jgi:hypothetical protein
MTSLRNITRIFVLYVLQLKNIQLNDLQIFFDEEIITHHKHTLSFVNYMQRNKAIRVSFSFLYYCEYINTPIFILILRREWL